MREMRRDGPCKAKIGCSHADRNRRAFSLPDFLADAATPPVDATSSNHMLDSAHDFTPCVQACAQLRNDPQPIPETHLYSMSYGSVAGDAVELEPVSTQIPC